MLTVLPELMGSSVIIKAVKWHLENLICLPQAIPCSVVSFIHFNGMSNRGGIWGKKE